MGLKTRRYYGAGNTRIKASSKRTGLTTRHYNGAGKTRIKASSKEWV
jgi:hypothetical protein